MHVLIDGDVVLYLALWRNETATLESAINHYNDIIEDTKDACFADTVEIFLSSDWENFRKNLYPVYKSNRKGKESPPFMSELKAEVLTWDNSRGSPAGEADDYLLIRAAELDEQGKPWIIATVDKDLKTYPGLFYNLRSHQIDKVGERRAYTFMLQQFVMGDSVDGIKGLNGWGPVKTAGIINPYHGLEENFKKTKEVWLENNKTNNTQEAYNETANLAFIRRRKNDLYPLDFWAMSGNDFRKTLRVPVSNYASS